MKEIIKKYWKFAVAGIIILILLFLLCTFVSWKNSPRFARFELSLAFKNNDATAFDKYFNYEKIVDKQISIIMQEAENDPFAGLAVAMVANLRPTLINQLQASFKEGAEKGTETKKENVFKLFLNSYNNQSDKGAVKIEKINENKEIFYNCPFGEAGCHKFVWEKTDKKWQVVEMNFEPIPVQEVFKAEK